MQPFGRFLALAMFSASIVDAADQNAPANSEQSEEIMVSEHPPLIVYFRHATPSRIRVARKALRTYCHERAPQVKKANPADPEEGPAIAHLCGSKPTILMGVNFRDEFNRKLYACRAEMDLHYVVYPLTFHRSLP